MHLNTLYLTLRSTTPIEGDASHLRGFFASRFNEYALLHQHVDVDKLLYRYPRIQYKIIDGDPLVLGIEEGAEVLKEIYDKYEEIRIKDTVYAIVERGITLREEEFGVSNKILGYTFKTPWIALNQENYERYLRSKRRERREILRRILVGNILSASKGLDYVVLDEIKLEIGEMKPVKCKIKKTPFMGFVGEFLVNFAIPEYMGLGKSVSRGFGAVVKVKNL